MLVWRVVTTAARQTAQQELDGHWGFSYILLTNLRLILRYPFSFHYQDSLMPLKIAIASQYYASLGRFGVQIAFSLNV